MLSIIARTEPLAARPASLGELLAASPLPRFLVVGLCGLVTDAFAFTALSRLGAPDWIARAASLGLATLLTWQLNRRFTFRASGRAPGSELTRYVAVALAAQGFNYGLFLLLRSAFPAVPALLALVGSAAAAAILSFLGQRTLTFSRVADPASPLRSSR